MTFLEKLNGIGTFAIRLNSVIRFGLGITFPIRLRRMCGVFPVMEWQLMAGRGRNVADDRLAVELASGKTITEAAKAAGVSERTAFRRMRDDAFKRRLSSARSEMVSAASGKLAYSLLSSVQSLRKLTKSGNDSVAIKASSKILELGLKYLHYADLEERLEDLERKFGTSNMA